MAIGNAQEEKLHAENPHVRFDEWEVASAATPRRRSLLYKMEIMIMNGESNARNSHVWFGERETAFEHRNGMHFYKAAKNLALAILTLIGSAVVNAEEIKLEQAETAVGNWIAKGGGFGKLAGRVGVSGKTLEDPDTGAKMHVVRVPGKGFVVTSADDGIEPIVLFSDGGDGDLVAEEGNPAWDLLRWDLAARTAALKEGDNGRGRSRLQSASGTGNGGQTKVSPKEKWASLLPEKNSVKSPRLMAASSSCVFNISDVRVSPLIHTEWGQTSVDGLPAYNYYTPGKIEIKEVQGLKSSNFVPIDYVNIETNEVGHYPCGCVATAGAQLMKKWKYPSSPKSLKSEVCKRDGQDLVLSMKGGPYKWSSMGDVRPHSDAAREAVGRVTFDIGVVCRASYAEKGTGMSSATLVEKLRTVFGYESAKWYSGSTILTHMKRIAIPNLEAKAPIILSIMKSKSDNSINHCVVADGYGYDNGDCWLHVNFGWNGKANAWYVPPDLDTGHEGLDYGFIRGFGYNIFPHGSGSLVSGRATGANGRALAGATVELCSTSGSVLSTTKTEKNGSYWFQQEPGDYKVRISLGGETDSASITLAECDEETIGNELKDWTITSAPSVADVSVVTSSTKSGAKGNADSSIISSPISVRLSCATANAEIHYTLDGTQPIPESPIFDGAITIQDTTTLRAVAYADGMECSETFEQTWTFVDPVSRDNFANARLIDGTSGRASFNNTGYTKESGEPIHSKDGTSGGTSAWAVWTAPESGDWTFYLSGVITNINEDMDTQLAVYTGTAVDALTRVVANDDVNATEGDYSSRVSFSAVKGMSYYIAMDSYRGASHPGTLALRWEEGFVHYAQFDYSSLFLPSSGGHIEIGVESSVAWSLVECSDWITPSAATGESGGSFAFDAISNTTGSERNGYVTIQADNSDFATLSIRQHVMDFVTTKEEAVESAWRTNKRILLVNGRETCANTSSTLFYSVPSSTVKPLLDAGYVIWYHNCDRQSEADIYGYGSMLPTVCILDPKDMRTYVARATGYQSASALKSLLDANSSWSGLPSPTGVELTGVRAIIAETPYSMNVTFDDGTVLNLKHGVTWTIASGSAATITNDGVLVPVAGRTGTVTVSGSVVLRGQTYTRTMDVRVINSATVTGVSVVGPEVIDLYWMANGGGSGGGDTPTTTYTVTLNANGGNVSSTTWTMTSGAAVGTLPTPTWDGYAFGGWFTAASGGTQVSASTIVAGDVTYYAHWTEIPPPPPPDSGELDVAFAKAQTVNEALYRGDALVGTVQVKVGKINKRGVVKVSATATMLIDGKVKKVTAKAVNVMLDATGRVPPVKVVFKAPIGEMAFEMAADGSFTLKNGSYLMAEATIGGALKGGSHGTFRMDGFDLAVPGELLDDILPNEESFSVSNGKWVFAKAATVKWAKDRVTKEYGIVVDDSKGKTNLSGLKLTYAAKTGQFKGSFKAYALEEKNGKTKLVKYTVNVIGFVVDGVGYGEASCKKPAATWSVTVK